MIEQIKQALDKANIPYKICEDTGDVLDKNDNTVADFIYHDEDAHLIANAPEWLRYIIGEVERKDKTIAELRERINGELEVSEQVTQEREELILENEQMNEALKNIRTHYVSVHDEDWKKAYDEIWNMAFPPKEGETQ